MSAGDDAARSFVVDETAADDAPPVDVPEPDADAPPKPAATPAKARSRSKSSAEAVKRAAGSRGTAARALKKSSGTAEPANGRRTASKERADAARRFSGSREPPAGSCYVPVAGVHAEAADASTGDAPPVNIELTLTCLVHHGAAGGLGLTIPALMQSTRGPFVVTAVDAASGWAGVVLDGDTIVAVDGNAPTTNSHLNQMLCRARRAAVCTLTVQRANLVQTQPAMRRRLMAEFTPTGDFAYMLVSLRYASHGPKLGLQIRDRQYKVLVTRTDVNSMGERLFVRGDRLVDVDAQPVTDKDAAKSLLMSALKTNKDFTVLVERPTSDKARRELDELLADAHKKHTQLSMSAKRASKERHLPADVLDMLAVERRRRATATTSTSGLAPILRVRTAEEALALVGTGVDHPTADAATDTVYDGARLSAIDMLSRAVKGRVKNKSHRSTVSIAKKASEVPIATSVKPGTRLKKVPKKFS